MNYQSEYSNQIKDAIDRVLVEADIPNFNKLARRLDVSKQALSKWRQTGLVPTTRAVQMELLSGGKVSWKELCPDIVDEFKAQEALKLTNRD